jgi:3alpha(or 20beta)-hydroxysteroid dehydrogenase
MGVLAGRVALVTGASRGQGAAIARLFAAEGATVVLGDILDREGNETAAELGTCASYLHLDVADESDWARAVATCVERHGKLDALVNNAGILRRSALTDTRLDDYLAVIAVNQVGVFLGMKAVAPVMTAAGGGTIVNTASIAGVIGLSGLVAYTASKFAVRGMTKTAALELARHNIRVNAVLPGRIDTAMARTASSEESETSAERAPDIRSGVAGIPAGRIGSPEDVARAVLFLTSDASAYCSGTELVVDGAVLAGPMAGAST